MSVRLDQRAQLRRLSLLVPYIQTHPGITIAALATEFRTSAEQIENDLSTLWFCGLPGQGMGELIEVAYEGDEVSIAFDAGIDRPLQLTREEATALIVALRFLAASPDLIDSDAATGALTKIENAVGDRAAGSTAISLGSTPAPQISAQIRQALHSGRALSIDYYVPTRDEKTERVIDPIRLLRVQDVDYLEAWCRRAEGIRTFRLDRIDRVSELDEQAQPAPSEPRDVSDGIFVPDSDAQIVRLDLSMSGRWVPDYYDITESTPGPGGTTQVSLPISDDETLEHLLYRLGPHGLAGLTDDHVATVARRIGARSADALTRYES